MNKEEDMWPFKKSPELLGEIYVSKSLTIVQRPPMHRTIDAGGRKHHFLLPYVQYYVFHEFTVRGLLASHTRFQRLNVSMTKEPMASLEDRVYPLPFGAGRPGDGYCMGSFSPKAVNREGVVRAAISHFWLSSFSFVPSMKDLTYLTNMGYSPERIFDEFAKFGQSQQAATVSGLPPSTRLMQWNEMSELELES